MTIRSITLATAFVALAAPALADGPAPVMADPAPAASPAPQPFAVFTAGLGAAVTPEYFGSDDYKLGPTGSFSLHFLRLGGYSFGNPDPSVDSTGFGVRGSFRYISARDTSDYPELAGLNDIDAAIELGLGVGYTARSLDVYAVARRGFGGHESWVGEAGIDLIARPTSDLTVTFGPRAFWGSDDYASTYFGVTPAEASASLPAYAARGGVLSAGLELGATYRIDDNWGLKGAITWDRLMNDAADSPIVQQGTEDQYGVSLVLTRAIRIGG